MMRSRACYSFMARRSGKKSRPSNPKSCGKYKKPPAALPPRPCTQRFSTQNRKIRVLVRTPISAARRRPVLASNDVLCSKMVRSKPRKSRASRSSKPVGIQLLWQAFFEFNVDAKRPVLIAQGYNRDRARHVVFHLNHLLLRGGDVRNVCYVQVRRQLLLNGDA